MMVVLTLLRVRAGETCAAVANGEQCKAELAGWDIATTDALADALRQRVEARAAAAAAAAAKVRAGMPQPTAHHVRLCRPNGRPFLHS